MHLLCAAGLQKRAKLQNCPAELSSNYCKTNRCVQQLLLDDAGSPNLDKSANLGKVMLHLEPEAVQLVLVHPGGQVLIHGDTSMLD